MNTTLISPLTQNAKLGFGVATTYRPVGDASKGEGTCSGKCPLLASGACYAMKALTKLQAMKSQNRHDDLDRLLLKGVNLVRLHTSGDFFGEGGELDTAYFETVLEWCRNNPTITVWTYCHDVDKLIAAGYSYKNDSLPENLHIVASVDSLDERTRIKDSGFRTARVIDTPDEKLSGETLCPYDYSLFKKEKPSAKCSTCQLCFNPKHKNDIAFIKH